MVEARNISLLVPTPDLLRAAKLIFVKPKTICNWLSLGKLKRYKAGRRTLLRKSEVVAMVREG